MAYQKQTWETGEIITEGKLNHMEDGIKAADTTFAPIASPALTGNPTAPTQSAGNNSTRIATTAYADRAATNAANAVSTATAEKF